MSALISATGDGRAGAGRPSQAAVAADRDSEALLDPVGGRIRLLRRICIGMSLLAVMSGTLMLVMTNRYIEGLLPRMLNVISVLASGIVCATAIRAFGPGGIIPAARRSDNEPHGTRSGEPPARNQASSESSSLPRGYRRYGRIVPRHDRTRVTLQDGTFHDATIVDFSRSGAALSVALHLPLGQRLMVGRHGARVVRTYANGMAVEFIQTITDDVFGENLIL